MTTNFKNLTDFVKIFSDETVCVQHFELMRWAGVVISPFDATAKVYKCKGFRYKCKNTGKYFNVKTGTIFEDSNIKLSKWFIAFYILCAHKKGISSYQLARDIGVTQKTGWFMLHRLRYAMTHKNFLKPLSGTVECDESYFGGKHTNQHYEKRINKNLYKQGASDKPAVFAMLERGGEVVAFNVGLNPNMELLQPIIKGQTDKDSTISYGRFRSVQGA